MKFFESKEASLAESAIRDAGDELAKVVLIEFAVLDCNRVWM